MSTVNGTCVPKHLDKAFFDDALENGLRESRVTTKQIKFSLCSGEGENYLSQIYRAVISFERGKESISEETSVIVKCIDSNGVELAEDMNVYIKEKLIYLDIMPRLEILLNDVKLAPRCFLAVKNPVRTIVFEDMDRTGFRVADREVGLDEDHMKLALRKIAQFHAASMVLATKDPSAMSQFQTGLLDPKTIVPTATFCKILHKYLAFIIKMVEQWQGFELISKKLQDFHNNFHSRLAACQEPRAGELKVLNHGDLWTNNIMFKYDAQNRLKDLVFVDFQLSIYGSPGIDLNFFLYSTAQLDVLKNWMDLLRIYHASLQETLVELRYASIPTFEDIMNEFKQKSPYGFFTLLGPLPITTMAKDLSKGNSFESLADSDEKLGPIFAQERLITHLKYSLKELDRLGALDK